MTEQDIELFIALTESKSITGAANRLFTTQSALTKRLQKLEEELGCNLFLRSRRGVTPTPAAESILTELLSIRDSLQKVRSQASSFGGQIAGTMEFGVSVNYARFHLPPILKQYMLDYPGVSVSVFAEQSRTIYKKLTDGELSVAILRGRFPWEGINILLSEESVCLVLSKENDRRPLDELPYISRRTDREFEERLYQWRQEQGLHRKRDHLQVNDISTCLAMVQSGIGWAVLPEICLKEFDGVIRPLSFSDGTRFTRETHLLYRPEYLELPQVSLFLESVLKAEGKQISLPGKS